MKEETRYELRFNGRYVKDYPFKIQAIIYCFMHGWVNTGFDDYYDNSKSLYFFDPRVSIVKHRYRYISTKEN